MNTPKPPLPGMTTLIVLVVSFRLLAIPLVRPGGFFSDWTDFYYYRGLASLADQGFYPFIHFWVEYPPLFPWLAVALHQFAMGLPPYRHPLLWFSIGLSALLTLADVASLVMLRRLGDRLWGPGGGLRCAWIAALLFAPFYASFEWFDSLPTAALLTGVELLCAGRFAIAGSALAVGSLLKLFPLSVVPVAVLAATGARQRLALGLGMLAVLLAVLGPLMVLGPTMTLASFASLANRGSWETPWALLDGYYAFGVVPSLVDRVLYPASAFWTTPGRSAWVWWPVALVASVAYLALLVRLRVDRATGRRGDGTYPDAPSPPSPPTPLPRGEGRGVRAAPSPVVVRLSGIAVVLTLLLLRGFSPQFTLWVLPFIVLHSPNARGVLLASVLTANNLFVEGYLYVNLFADRPWLLGLTVAVRTVLLVGFGVALLEPLLPPVARVYRRLRPVALVVGMAAGLALLGLTAVRLAPVFVDRAVVSNPYADAVQPLAAISPDAVVVFTQTGVYDALAPYLAGQPRHLLANDTLIGRLGPGTVPRRLSEWLGSGALVVVEDEAKPRPQVSSVVAQWLAANAQVDDARRAGSVRIQTYRSRRLPVEPTMRAVFGDTIVLRGIAVEPLAARPGGTVRVTLVWEALQKMAQDYTVSVQLIGPDGRLVAQRDAMPLDNAYPTSIWHAGEMVPDAVKVSVPESAPPGEYRLILVLYDYVTLQRLPVGGVDHLALAPVTVW